MVIHASTRLQQQHISSADASSHDLKQTKPAFQLEDMLEPLHTPYILSIETVGLRWWWLLVVARVVELAWGLTASRPVK